MEREHGHAASPPAPATPSCPRLSLPTRTHSAKPLVTGGAGIATPTPTSDGVSRTEAAMRPEPMPIRSVCAAAVGWSPGSLSQ